MLLLDGSNRRRYVLIAGAVLLCIFFLVHIAGSRTSSVIPSSSSSLSSLSEYYRKLYNTKWEWNFERDELNYGLTDEQCDIAFPKLFREIDRALHYRKQSGKNITSKDLDNNMVQNGMARIMVYKGKLYIIKGYDELTPVFHERTNAALHQLNRAISSVSNPKDIPNVEFIWLMEDTAHTGATSLPADRILWTYSRKTTDRNIWTIPEYGKWSELGAPEDVRREMDLVEADINRTTFSSHRPEEDLFDRKTSKLLWRGVTWTNPDIRESLLNATADKPWADVAEVGPDTAHNNHIPITEQCRWQYIAYTEGISHSGRLKYQQNCRSVIFSHYLEYITPWMALLEPNGTDQNVVMVRRDWSDLEEKVTALQDDPALARRIALNNVRDFKERYNTGAAEACYWRRLLRSWREVSFEPSPYGKDEWSDKTIFRGTAFETFTMPLKFHYQQVPGH